MKKMLVMMLILALVLVTLPALADYDPVVVQVNACGYTRSQVQEALSLAKKSYEQQGNIVTKDIEEQMLQDILTYFIQQGILENKMMELGLNQPTLEEMKQMEEDVQEQWTKAQEQARQQLMTEYALSQQKAEEYAPMYLELAGITLEELRLEISALLKQKKITEYVTKDSPRLTDEDVMTWYQVNMVQPGESAYRENIEAFETEVLLNGVECYYIPDEYRYVKSIVFLAPQQDREAVQLLMLDLKDAEEELEKTKNAVYGCQVLGEDASEALAAQEAAQSLIAELKKEIEEKKLALAEPFAEQIADIMRRLEAGESFATLQEEYDQNDQPAEEGYLVCAESIIWENAFRDGAMSLEKPGDFTGPVYLTAGPQFLYYEKDAPRGALPLSDEDFEKVRLLAQAETDNELLISFIEKWQKEYDIQTHEELMRVN